MSSPVGDKADIWYGIRGGIMTIEQHHHHAHQGGHRHHVSGHGHGHGGYDSSNLRRADYFYGPVYEQILAWLNISPGTAVLEAGSGAGGFTELLAEAVGQEGSVTALDVIPELLQTVRQRLDSSPLKGRVSYHEGDIQQLPFENRQFDVVWSSRTVHHLPDQLAGVRELCRVLKPGGRLLLREGGLRPQVLPADVGIGEPGLEDRLALAFHRWFHAHVRGGKAAVRYPYGWTQLLRDAGLVDVTAKSFLLEQMPPFTELQVEYMARLLSRWVDSDERRTFISDEDADVIQQLVDVDSPRYVFNRQDLHYIEAITVYLGKA